MSKFPFFYIYTSLFSICFFMISFGDLPEQYNYMFVDFFRREVMASLFEDRFSGYYREVRSLSSALYFFRLNAFEIGELTKRVLHDVDQEIKKIIALESSKKNFENTIRAFDIINAYFMNMFNRVKILSMVHPNKEIRDAAQEAVLEFENKLVDLFDANTALYQTFKNYYENTSLRENLSETQKYAIEQLLEQHCREGADRSLQEQEELRKLKKEIQFCESQFQLNIINDSRSILVSAQELEGISEDILNSLSCTDDGLYVVGIDYPTYNEVMKYCSVEETRKRLYREFQNRAYPNNEAVLERLIALRDEFAKKLGFENYVQFQLDSNMAKTITNVENMWKSIEVPLREKAQKEFSNLIPHIPSSIHISPDNCIAPWNYLYLETLYQQKYFNFDQRQISEYFPMEKTIQAIFGIYQQFFNLRFKLIQARGLWDPLLYVIEVFANKDNRLLGYIFLDLHPRPNKYNHACLHDAIKGVQYFDQINKKYVDIPSVSFVITNFPKSTQNKPSLLRHENVATFFHEFGHAMHEVLGQSEFAFTSGTTTKIDFVEAPSQMFEQWMWDKNILKKISSHYQTGEPLPDHLIDALIEKRQFNIGYTMLRQIAYGKLSLEYFKDSLKKNPTEIAHTILKNYLPNLLIDPENHFHVSFGHLTEYAGGYYGYMWSKILASDIFSYIQEHGLLNSDVGERFANTVLRHGGSKDPYTMVCDFLGRVPKNDAFLNDLKI